MTRARSLIIQRHFKVSAIDNLRFFITFYSLFSSVLPVPPPPFPSQVFAAAYRQSRRVGALAEEPTTTRPPAGKTERTFVHTNTVQTPQQTNILYCTRLYTRMH